MLTPLGFSHLRQLSDGAFHSGEDLAARVGLTRARVSQLLRQAETAGLSLERVRGRGYRLMTAPDFLDAARVREALTDSGVKLATNGLSPLRPQLQDDDSAIGMDVVAEIASRPVRSTSNSSTSSTRRRASCCAARRAATSTAP